MRDGGTVKDIHKHKSTQEQKGGRGLKQNWQWEKRTLGGSYLMKLPSITVHSDSFNGGMQGPMESLECFCAEVVLISAKLSLTSDVLGDRMKGDISMQYDGDHTVNVRDFV